VNDGDKARLWQDVIVDHSQFPRHHGKPGRISHQAEGENPLCGDRVRLYLEIDPTGTITTARFEATGCAISLASASLLTVAVQGQSRQQAMALFEQARDMMTSGNAVAALASKDIEALRLVSRFPLRVKCASLSWHALRQALSGGEGPVSTEQG